MSKPKRRLQRLIRVCTFQNATLLEISCAGSFYILHFLLVISGRYPIHFHMCLNTSHSEPYIRDCSIHDTFARCITIHGTHGVKVGLNTSHSDPIIRDCSSHDTFAHCVTINGTHSVNVTLHIKSFAIYFA